MNGRQRLRKNNPLLAVFLWIYAGLSVYPLLWMVFYSFKNNNEIFVTNPFGFPIHFRFENYADAWSRFNVPVYFSNSLLVAAATVVGTIALSVTFSYAVARMQWRWKEAARIYIIIGMFIPIQVIMIPLAILVRDFHLANTYWALIVPYIAFNISFSSMVFYGFSAVYL